jgi:myo-inositol-1(or 4)-monophosphatase
VSDVANRALELAESLARQAGEMLMESLAGGVEMELKGEIDPVTALDRKVERFLVENIRSQFPDHDFLAEEETCTSGGSAYRWVIDPIDGTTNFAHGYPCFVVSIALELNGDSLLGVIYQPATREMFSARAGGGAFLDGRRLKVAAGEKTLDRAFLVTGFPYNVRQPGVAQRNLGRFEKFLTGSFAVRRDGSAAYDLACVAAGRFDGFWEENLSHWDTAAGCLMVREAGGIITDFDGAEFDQSSSKTVLAAAGGKLHGQMLEVLQQAD